MIEGPLALVISTSVKARRIDLVSECEVSRQLAGDHESGYPEIAALRLKTHDATVGTQYELLLYPEPDVAYTVYYRCRLPVSAIDATNIYPPGGEVHAETILESCLSVAESRMNDEEGIHVRRFMERLQASVSHDRKLACPDTIGYNLDRSDDWGDVHAWSRSGSGSDSVTYGGVLY